jgi:hypothetical protein
MQNVELLVNEIQLGQQLATAVSHKRGSDFAMMLAMMSHNVLDHGQFCLPTDSVAADEVDETQLRQQLGLAAPTSFAAVDESSVQSILLGVDLHTEGMVDIKLKGYLSPEPLSMFDDPKHIPEAVLTNCEPTTMTRHQTQEERVSQKLEHNEAGLYEVLESMKQAA